VTDAGAPDFSRVRTVVQQSFAPTQPVAKHPDPKSTTVAMFGGEKVDPAAPMDDPRRRGGKVSDWHDPLFETAAPSTAAVHLVHGPAGGAPRAQPAAPGAVETPVSSDPAASAPAETVVSPAKRRPGPAATAQPAVSRPPGTTGAEAVVRDSASDAEGAEKAALASAAKAEDDDDDFEERPASPKFDPRYAQFGGINPATASLADFIRTHPHGTSNTHTLNWKPDDDFDKAPVGQPTAEDPFADLPLPPAFLETDFRGRKAFLQSTGQEKDGDDSSEAQVAVAATTLILMEASRVLHSAILGKVAERVAQFTASGASTLLQGLHTKLASEEHDRFHSYQDQCANQRADQWAAAAQGTWRVETELDLNSAEQAAQPAATQQLQQLMARRLSMLNLIEDALEATDRVDAHYKSRESAAGSVLKQFQAALGSSDREVSRAVQAAEGLLQTSVPEVTTEHVRLNSTLQLVIEDAQAVVKRLNAEARDARAAAERPVAAEEAVQPAPQAPLDGWKCESLLSAKDQRMDSEVAVVELALEVLTQSRGSSAPAA